MTRWVTPVALAVAVLGFARADGSNDDLAQAQRKELEGKAAALAREGDALQRAGELPDAAQRLEAALELRRRLYPLAQYSGMLVTSLEVALLLFAQIYP